MGAPKRGATGINRLSECRNCRNGETDRTEMQQSMFMECKITNVLCNRYTVVYWLVNVNCTITSCASASANIPFSPPSLVSTSCELPSRSDSGAVLTDDFVEERIIKGIKAYVQRKNVPFRPSEDVFVT